MNFFVIILGIIFTIFSTAVLSYISMATMIGPWIAPVIVLMSSVILKMGKKFVGQENLNKNIALVQTIGSVGGIVAIGVGFSLPTLYFLDANIFNNLIQKPVSFSIFIAILCFCAGGLGIWLAGCFANSFIKKKNLNFPVSHLIYNMITSQSQQKQAKSMFFGIGASWIICFLKDGFLWTKGILFKVYYLFPNFAGNHIEIILSPMFWAIGFIIGIKVAFPLLIGMISKYLVLYLLNNHSYFLNFNLFLPLSDYDFVIAFCSGLVVSELILGFFKYPLILKQKIRSYSVERLWEKLRSFNEILKQKTYNRTAFTLFFSNIEPAFVLICSTGFLYYLGFGFPSLILLLIFIIVATRQISYIGAKIGFVTFGRFATFIMIPMMLLFSLDFVQITFLCVFFNVCAAAASDLLFDYKVGQLCGISFDEIKRYQWIGLLVASMCIGIFLYILFTSLHIGSPELFAQRGQTRALLIQSLNFDLRVVILGLLYGVILKKIGISPTLVLGGILMPNRITIGLMLGALISKLSGRVKDQFPFWCGIFAGESVWVMFSVISKMFY